MTDLQIFFVGNRDPDLTGTITTDGTPDGTVLNLTSSTVKLKMRAVGSTTLKVNTAATIVSAAAGSVSYPWAAIDVDTAGYFLCSWETTTAGTILESDEFLIEIRAHSPLTRAYLELEEMRQALSQTGTYADPSFRRAILAASRSIDNECGRRFWLDADANQVRYYTPSATGLVFVDDLAVLTSLGVDQGGDGTFEETWVASTEYLAEPMNAVGDGRPYTRIVTPSYGTKSFALGSRSVKVTGQFGWPSVPDPIVQATSILAARLQKRERETPLGVAGTGFDGGAVRVPKVDPDVMQLIGPYVKHTIA